MRQPNQLLPLCGFLIFLRVIFEGGHAFIGVVTNKLISCFFCLLSLLVLSPTNRFLVFPASVGAVTNKSTPLFSNEKVPPWLVFRLGWCCHQQKPAPCEQKDHAFVGVVTNKNQLLTFEQKDYVDSPPLLVFSLCWCCHQQKPAPCFRTKRLCRFARCTSIINIILNFLRQLYINGNIS
jgi:hypothetical protein